MCAHTYAQYTEDLSPHCSTALKEAPHEQHGFRHCRAGTSTPAPQCLQGAQHLAQSQCQVRTSYVKPTRDKVVVSDMGNQSTVPPPFCATSSSCGCNTRFFLCSFTAVHEAPFLLPPPAASHCQGAHHNKLCWFVTAHVALPPALNKKEQSSAVAPHSPGNTITIFCWHSDC